jgi:hypothetical protein
MNRPIFDPEIDLVDGDMIAETLGHLFQNDSVRVGHESPKGF